MMAFYPVNQKVADKVTAWPEAPLAAKLRLERLDKANGIVEKLAGEFGYRYICVNEEYATDGIHMWPSAYELIFDNMKKYIFE